MVSQLQFLGVSARFTRVPARLPDEESPKSKKMTKRPVWPQWASVFQWHSMVVGGGGVGRDIFAKAETDSYIRKGGKLSR